MDWQPIETAPKDGTRVLVVDDDGQQFVAAWNDGVEMAFGKPTGWAFPYWAYATHGDETGADCPHVVVDPTHWMPLPPPPIKTPATD